MAPSLWRRATYPADFVTAFQKIKADIARARRSKLKGQMEAAGLSPRGAGIEVRSKLNDIQIKGDAQHLIHHRKRYGLGVYSFTEYIVSEGDATMVVYNRHHYWLSRAGLVIGGGKGENEAPPGISPCEIGVSNGRKSFTVRDGCGGPRTMTPG